MTQPRIAACGLLSALVLALPGTAEDRPEGFERILERGRIAAIDTPVYVAAEAARIPEDAWVLGFVIDGSAFAYSLNLLDAHEVVNDKAGDQAFAAVW